MELPLRALLAALPAAMNTRNGQQPTFHFTSSCIVWLPAFIFERRLTAEEKAKTMGVIDKLSDEVRFLSKKVLRVSPQSFDEDNAERRDKILN